MEISLIIRQGISRKNAKGNLGVDFHVFERNYTANRDHRLIVLVIDDEHNALPLVGVVLTVRPTPGRRWRAFDTFKRNIAYVALTRKQDYRSPCSSRHEHIQSK
jgi:hypothetical protein